MLSLKIFKVFITILLAILVSFTGWVHFSPRPTTWLVHNLFKNGMAVKPPNYNEIEETVSTIKDLIYPSNHKDNLLDMHFPKDVKDKIPVIFFGYTVVPTLVAIKKDVTEYAIQIASHGFAVVNINYELAPSATYPGPIIQLTEAYQYITEIAADYPFDLDQIFFLLAILPAHKLPANLSIFKSIPSMQNFLNKLLLFLLTPFKGLYYFVVHMTSPILQKRVIILLSIIYSLE